MSPIYLELMDRDKPILIFGRDGQLGKALQILLKNLHKTTVFVGRSDCDLSNVFAIKEVLNCYQPQVIINAAAYTAVDKAESESELAFAINANAPQVMAQYISAIPNGIFINYSTDYVFGDTKNTAYSEMDDAGPIDRLCVYGQSKLAGECGVSGTFKFSSDPDNQKGLTNSARYFILRTSWVYGDGVNFIRTMLRLAAERSELKVVVDQVGVPTSAQWLAQVTLQLLGSNAASGIYHVVPDGVTSWYGLAQFAITEAISAGSLKTVDNLKLLPIPAVEYSPLAKRPHNSRLTNSKLKSVLFALDKLDNYPTWQDQVSSYVKNECS